MAFMFPDHRDLLRRANKEIRAAIVDCEQLLERSRKMLERSGQDNKPR
jgi:hypothetical protein